MKKHLKVFGIQLCVLLLAGCATIDVQRIVIPVTPPKPFIDQAIWSKITKDKVYTACLTVLHMQGFSLHPVGTSKESGLIIIGRVDVKSITNVIKSYYTLQILVSELPDNKVMVDVRVKGSYKPIDIGEWRYNPSYESARKNMINNKVSEDLEKFFTQMDILLGKAEYCRGDRVLDWEE